MKIKTKLPLCLIKHNAMKACVEAKAELHTFLTSALEKAFTFILRPSYPRETEPGNDWVGPKGGLVPTGNQTTVLLTQSSHYTD
jgi:hypothetical protein